MKQQENYTFSGLQQDLDISKQPNNYLCDAHNIRITAREGSSLLSLTNERGPLKFADNTDVAYTFVGTYLGHCVLNKYLVLFTHYDDTSDEDNPLSLDFIYRINAETKEIILLYDGAAKNKLLGFNVNYPIETLGSYENENIQKVYWTDGLNQPRIINIVKDNYANYTEKSFDFVQELALQEDVSVTCLYGTTGIFAPGTILYAFTYYNKYGQESNIFYITELNYIAHKDRGGSPEDRINVTFKIELTNLENGRFDYVRVYSIQRTSVDATPVVRRVQDIQLNSSGIVYYDNGTTGSAVDATEMLYIGGEEILAGTMTLKDGTLFMGNIQIKRHSISTDIKNLLKSKTTIYDWYREVNINYVSNTASYKYLLNPSVNTSGFKMREYYRIGVLLLHKSGKWSEPIWIGDHKMGTNIGYISEDISTDVLYNQSFPALIDHTTYYSDYATLRIPTLKLYLNVGNDKSVLQELYNAGYRKFRALAVFPDVNERLIAALGIVSATVYTTEDRGTVNSSTGVANGKIAALSSWFFRPFIKDGVATGGNDDKNFPFSVSIPDESSSVIPYMEEYQTVPTGREEIQGYYNKEHRFRVDWLRVTFHSPDVVFDDSLYNLDLLGLNFNIVGYVTIDKTYSDINITMSSAPIGYGESANTHSTSLDYGFILPTIKESTNGGIIGGFFYRDFLVDDDKNSDEVWYYEPYDKEESYADFYVFPWHKSGSLNNDGVRGAEYGARSSVLNEKVISNLRYSGSTVYYEEPKVGTILGTPVLYHSEEAELCKVYGEIYYGNIDTLLTPDKYYGVWFKGRPNEEIASTYLDTYVYHTYADLGESGDPDYDGIYYKQDSSTKPLVTNIGDHFRSLLSSKEAVRMRYKSSPHIYLRLKSRIANTSTSDNYTLPLVELYRTCDDTYKATVFGGTSDEALQNNMWIPAGKPVMLNLSSASHTILADYGDTWFQRFDCLKTYPFTHDDANQLVEICSFLCENHINIDGRYDRNKALTSNLAVSNTNFNMYNSVYGQKNNFFVYRIFNNDYYNLNTFSNQITWSTEKHAGEDTDPWTKVTLASTLDLDGSKGPIEDLETWNDTIYCFQDRGISNIIFNARVLIPTSDNVPIEITNSYKVDGKKYLSDDLGCKNKFTVKTTPNGIYFVDTMSKDLHHIGGQGLANVSYTKNMSTWFNNQRQESWTPVDFTLRTDFDTKNSDLYITSETESLVYSEKLQEFTSFMSYGGVPAMFNIESTFYCFNDDYLYYMFQGNPNWFFGVQLPYDITFICNGASNKIPYIDKTFTNIDFRADKWESSLWNTLSNEQPFDYVQVWNEYLDTQETVLATKGTFDTKRNHQPVPSNLKKKFRIWDILIPRADYNIYTDVDGKEEGDTNVYGTEEDSNTYTPYTRKHSRDRIRNPWCKIKLGSSSDYRTSQQLFNLHDLNVTYYI